MAFAAARRAGRRRGGLLAGRDALPQRGPAAGGQPRRPEAEARQARAGGHAEADEGGQRSREEGTPVAAVERGGEAEEEVVPGLEEDNLGARLAPLALAPAAALPAEEGRDERQPAPGHAPEDGGPRPLDP